MGRIASFRFLAAHLFRGITTVFQRSRLCKMADHILPEAEAAAQRLKLRQALKQVYLKQITHPNRHGAGEGGYVFDPAFQRFASMKVSNLEHFKVTKGTSLFGFFGVVVPFVGLSMYIKYAKGKQEKALRTGQVAYRDRHSKFL